MKWHFLRLCIAFAVIFSCIVPAFAYSGAEVAGMLAIGEAQTKRRNYKDAIAVYDLLIAADPNNSDAHFWRAICHSYSGDIRGAIDDNTRAISLRPSFASAYSNRGSDFF